MHEMSPIRSSQESSVVKRLDSLLRTLIRDFGIENSIRIIEAKKNWHTLFSEPISCHMTPYRVTEGVMFLNVDSPVWLQELTYLKKDIIEKLSPYDIKDVRFKLGKVPKKAGSGIRDQGFSVKKLSPEEVSYTEKMVSPIIDEELRGTVKRALEKSISSGKTKERL